MGHIINARSFRLGWHSKWADHWYEPVYNYASFMFICARQRAILRMFLYARVMDKTPYIFSHFEIEKIFKFVKIKIYFYFVPFESLVRRIYRNLSGRLRRWKYKYYHQKYRRI